MKIRTIHTSTLKTSLVLLIISLFMLPALPALGQVKFQKTFADSNKVDIGALAQAPNGNYIVGGTRRSPAGSNNGGWLMMELNQYGEVLKQSVYGQTGEVGESLRNILQVTDSTVVAYGRMSTIYGTSGEEFGYVKYTADLDSVIWTYATGGTGNDIARNATALADGGFAGIGWSRSFPSGTWNYYIQKVNADGTGGWKRVIGGSSTDKSWGITATPDSGCIVTGTYFSNAAYGEDLLITKLDKNGNVEWHNKYNQTYNDIGYDIITTLDGGYAVTGHVIDSDGSSGHDVIVLKVDSAGAVEWANAYGGSADDEAAHIRQLIDSSYVIAGRTKSFGAGNWDGYLFKVDKSGSYQWGKAYGGSSHDRIWNMTTTADGGYLLGAQTKSFGSSDFEGYLIKADASGNSGCNETSGGSSWSLSLATNTGITTSTASGDATFGHFGVLALSDSVRCNNYYGMTCDDAIHLPDSNQSITTYTGDSVMWFKFTAKDDSVGISCIQKYMKPFNILGVEVYEGECNNLTLIGEQDSLDKDLLYYLDIVLFNLMKDSIYYVKVIQENNSQSSFHFGTYNFEGGGYSPYPYSQCDFDGCEYICNGDFEAHEAWDNSFQIQIIGKMRVEQHIPPPPGVPLFYNEVWFRSFSCTENVSYPNLNFPSSMPASVDPGDSTYAIFYAKEETEPDTSGFSGVLFSDLILPFSEGKYVVQYDYFIDTTFITSTQKPVFQISMFVDSLESDIYYADSIANDVSFDSINAVFPTDKGVNFFNDTVDLLQKWTHYTDTISIQNTNLPNRPHLVLKATNLEGFISSFPQVTDAPLYLDNLSIKKIPDYPVFEAGVGDEEGMAVAVDETNNYKYIGGYYTDSFLTPVLLSPPVGEQNAYIIKYDDSVEFDWAVSLETQNSGDSVDLAEMVVDANGNILATGSFTGSLKVRDTNGLGGTTYTSNGGFDVWVAKLNSSGVLQWITTDGDPAVNEKATGITVDGSNNAIVVGSMDGQGTIGTSIFYDGTPPKLDGFIAEFDEANGAVNAQGATGSSSLLVPTAVTMESGGDFWVGGSDGSNDLVFELQDATSLGNPYNEYSYTNGDIQDLALDADNNLVITGEVIGSSLYFAPGYELQRDGTTNDTYVAKFATNATGIDTISWARSFGNNTNPTASTALGVSDSNSVYVGGHYTGTINYNGTDYQAYAEDIYVAKYSDDGTEQWFIRGDDTSNDNDYLYDLYVTADSREVYFSGSFGDRFQYGCKELTDSNLVNFLLVRIGDTLSVPYYSKMSNSETEQPATALEPETAFRVYPNPANQSITFSTPASGTLAIYTAFGEQVFAQRLSAGETTLSLTSLSNGMYLYRWNPDAESNGYIQQGKFVKLE